MDKVEIELPEEAEVILGGGRMRLRCSTTIAAEIIRSIAGDLSGFKAAKEERDAIAELAVKIASRYSGH